MMFMLFLRPFQISLPKCIFAFEDLSILYPLIQTWYKFRRFNGSCYSKINVQHKKPNYYY